MNSGVAEVEAGVGPIDTETLAKEVAGFGVHVTAIEPGGFRTDWAGRSMVRAERTLTHYDEPFGPQRLQPRGRQWPR